MKGREREREQKIKERNKFEEFNWNYFIFKRNSLLEFGTVFDFHCCNQNLKRSQRIFRFFFAPLLLLSKWKGILFRCWFFPLFKIIRKNWENRKKRAKWREKKKTPKEKWRMLIRYILRFSRWKIGKRGKMCFSTEKLNWTEWYNINHNL